MRSTKSPNVELFGEMTTSIWQQVHVLTISALFVYKQERSNHMFSMNESNDEKKSSIRTGSIN
jgi:hypothetical protein